VGLKNLHDILPLVVAELRADKLSCHVSGRQS